MRLSILNMFMFIFILGCTTQQKITLKYIGCQYSPTLNVSFLNKSLIFLKGKDTIKLNVKIPFDSIKNEVINMGIYFNCFLKKDSTYVIILKKVCPVEMNDVPSNYYKINCIKNVINCSKFTEVRLNTTYKYEGNYGSYVDFKNSIYRIVSLNPSDNCSFQH